MYKFDDKVPTEKASAGVNLCYWIVIHHTAGGSYKGNLKYLSEKKVPTKLDPKPRQNTVSCHFVIGPKGEAGKIGDPKQILWHAGNGSRGRTPNVNHVMMGIEVVGVGEYNKAQYDKLTDLVKYLVKVFNIQKDNVIRHSDCTQSAGFTSKKILRDGKRKVKKRDIWPNFFPEGFEKWRDNIYS